MDKSDIPYDKTKPSEVMNSSFEKKNSNLNNSNNKDYYNKKDRKYYRRYADRSYNHTYYRKHNSNNKYRNHINRNNIKNRAQKSYNYQDHLNRKDTYNKDYHYKSKNKNNKNPSIYSHDNYHSKYKSSYRQYSRRQSQHSNYNENERRSISSYNRSSRSYNSYKNTNKYQSKSNSYKKNNTSKIDYRSNSSKKSYCSSKTKSDAGHYDYQVGDIIEGKYKIKAFLSDGTFGRVLECMRLNNNNVVNRDNYRNENNITVWPNQVYALKIIRPVKRYIESAEIERDIINDIQKDEKSKSHIVNMVDSFKFKREGQEYMAIVFERLGSSLYEFIEKNKYLGFSIEDIKIIARQILLGMKFLHEDINIIHTDLKPENILFENSSYSVIEDFKKFPSNVKEKIKTDKEYRRNQSYSKSNGQNNINNNDYSSNEREFKDIKYKVPKNLKIKIIDFGGATYFKEAHDNVINTRQYRSPEVILGCCNWDEKSDIWSLACIFVELYSGELLFPTHDNYEHLAMMQKITKDKCFPAWMAGYCRKQYRKYFHEEDKYTAYFKTYKLPRKNFENYASMLTLNDLLRKMLYLDPIDRISCREALEHEFFK